MPYVGSVYKVMIASPGEVANERRIAREVIYQWNAIHSEDRKTVLLPVAWETHASPAMGDRAQEIINKQLLRDSDLLAAIFWTRLGTPTGVAPSGTVEEIEKHLEAGKPAMLYFSAQPVRPDSIDDQQYGALRQFRESCRQRGLVEEYESIGEFQEKFARHLAQTVIQRFPATNASVTGDNVPINDSDDTRLVGLASLPVEGRQLLREAITDRNGTVLAVQTMEGTLVTTNERNFAERGNVRSEARWRWVVQDLVERGLLRQRDTRGEVFSVTDEGYRVADLVNG